MLGAPRFTPSLAPALEQVLRLTSPGTADICDVNSLHICGECGHWSPSGNKRVEGVCTLYAALMRGRRGDGLQHPSAPPGAG
jgi:hypothetical protein